MSSRSGKAECCGSIKYKYPAKTSCNDAGNGSSGANLYSIAKTLHPVAFAIVEVKSLYIGTLPKRY